MSDLDIERIVEQVVNECSGKTVQTREEGYRLFARRAAELAVAKERDEATPRLTTAVAAEKEDRAWLIEVLLCGETRYWTGRGTSDTSFSNNHLEAVRFLRRQDADAVLFWVFGGKGRSAEHLWIDPPRAGKEVGSGS